MQIGLLEVKALGFRRGNDQPGLHSLEASGVLPAETEV